MNFDEIVNKFFFKSSESQPNKNNSEVASKNSHLVIDLMRIIFGVRFRIMYEI
jgi:hypothetical protein